MSERSEGTGSDRDRRRRRIRRAAVGPRVIPQYPEPPAATPDRAGAGATPEDRETERGLRGLVGAGASQLGTGAALRARDAARPTEADLAEAEQHLVLVRRNWTPR